MRCATGFVTYTCNPLFVKQYRNHFFQQTYYSYGTNLSTHVKIINCQQNNPSDLQNFSNPPIFYQQQISKHVLQSLQTLNINLDPQQHFGNRINVLNQSPVLLHISNLLTLSQSQQIIRTQTTKKNSQESNLYLNYRVNHEIHKTGISNEAADLLSSTDDSISLQSNMLSGFRSQINPNLSIFQPVLEEIKLLLGFENRQFKFEEGLWIRPSKRQVVIRDQTTVKYEKGEGVAPHIDGKDITILIGLQEADKGGETVFLEENLAIKLKQGDALVYSSKSELLHFAQPVEQGTKWVLQLLIDCKIRSDEMDVDYTTGKVYT